MIKRSECRCPCHQGLMVHMVACCEDDGPTMSDPRPDRVRYAEETILDLHAEIERLRALIKDPAMCGVELSEENDRLIDENAKLRAALRCEVTGNPVGTDTWKVGYPCPCAACRALTEGKPLGSDLPGPGGIERGMSIIGDAMTDMAAMIQKQKAEIERLRVALSKIAYGDVRHDGAYEFMLMARRALANP